MPDPGTMEGGATPAGPLVVASVRPGEMPGIGLSMARGLVNDLICALIAAWLLLRAPGLGYWQKVCFVCAVGLVSGLAVHVDYWNWFGFPGLYTGIQVLDHLLGWTLAGLAMAPLAKA